MARRKYRKTQDEAAVDIAPMLDVVFIMLIFFIVTTSFVKETGVEVDRPSAESAVVKERGNILVAIRENGEIWMNRRQIDVRNVRANIERALAENPEGQVVLVADQASVTGLLVTVYDQAKMAGASSISIATEATD
ncbi:biopolymer transporter ExbD [Coraliomargarita sp. SDUM461003]|uniref:Biopolymer transporter ExbD n=1 Tax=Thalassobacterium maritimum TaxID=3041265 RepID=A0ABU1AZ94_9BACT|nr:biopolymer transporter ExbD [Coraliomargarita sp. SDUM461003]MDQ8209483.1 biopolymer transporter ExbD [Coraliomargarita sp. SDUM461003]